MGLVCNGGKRKVGGYALVNVHPGLRPLLVFLRMVR
jgi:hypothetical protein